MVVDDSQLLASAVRGLRDMAVAPKVAWCVADEPLLLVALVLLLLAVDSGGRSPNRSSILGCPTCGCCVGVRVCVREPSGVSGWIEVDGMMGWNGRGASLNRLAWHGASG